MRIEGMSLANQLHHLQQNQSNVTNKVEQAAEQSTFQQYLQESFASVNQSQQVADKMSTDLASGKSESIHETMLALTQAELSFNMLVQVRNKALESYQEVMRMQV